MQDKNFLIFVAEYTYCRKVTEILYSLIDAVILYTVPALITIGILGALTAILWDCIDKVKKWRKKRKTYRQQHQEELRAKKEKREELFQTILATIIAIILLGIYLYCKKINSCDYYDQASEYYLDRLDKM